MAETWMIVLSPKDRPVVEALAERRAKLGLEDSYAETVRAAVRLAASASDDDLRQGVL